MHPTYRLLVASALVLTQITSIAQEGCEYQPGSKVSKWLEQSKDSKKYSQEERFEFLEKSLEEEPNCLPALQRLGELNFLKSKRTGAPFTIPKQYLEKLIEICPEYHSEPYYFLGAMCYADHEYDQALIYFEKFLRFPDSDPTKFEKDYQKKYAEVEEAIPTLKKYKDVYGQNIEFNPIKVAGVSSKNDDYLPLISPDGEIMFFTRKFEKQAKGDFSVRLVEEFTWSRRADINTTFDEGFPLPPPFNMGENIGGATISVDNKELILAKKNPLPKNPENFDLYSAKYSLVTNEKTGEMEYVWSELERLSDLVNSDGWDSQPSLSGDGMYLFFAGARSECMKDGSGNYSTDIFVSKRQEDGSWGQAKPLPATINTIGKDKAPYMHSDSRSLYFSSDGHVGAGGLDIFYCKMNDDGTFTEPKNIGVPINTEKDELGIVVTSDGEIAYFGAKDLNNQRGWDVYQFKMPEPAKPEKVMILKGEVKSEDGNPPQNATVEVKYTQSKTVQKVNVNSDDGRYAAVVKVAKKEDVVVSVQGDNVAFNTRVVMRKEDTAPPVVAKLNMETQVSLEGKPFVINDIYYSTSKADIENRSFLILDEFAAYLNEHPTIEIEIRGHTDNVGNDAANMALSTDRAFEVLRYLTNKGVDGKRITYKGYGETKPVGDNNSEEGRALNRRTEFVIKKM
jgi:outer membrane protein OmpA-like peptidoglycan-associated protein/tetratricopeptide (TPR) repeat protein